MIELFFEVGPRKPRILVPIHIHLPMAFRLFILHTFLLPAQISELNEGSLGLMEGSPHYTLSQLRAWKNKIRQERKQLDREELFVEQRMAGLLKEEEEKRKNFKRKRMKVNLQKEKVSEDSEGESEESDSAEEGESDSAEKAAKKKKILKKVNLKKRVESEEAAERYAEEGADSEWYEGETEEEWYAWKWVEQNGEDYGIPKQYTPCVYFFKNHDCQKEEKCEWSHNCLQSFSW